MWAPVGRGDGEARRGERISPGRIRCLMVTSCWTVNGGPLIQKTPGSRSKEFASNIGAAVGDPALLIGADPPGVHQEHPRGGLAVDATGFSVFHASARGVPGYVYDQPDCYRTKSLLNQLVRALPTVTVIELDIVIREMRAVVDQVARALELVLA